MNDRRKTFNTPLEFWQWAIMEPGKRKASAGKGHEPVCVVVGNSAYGVGHILLEGSWPTKTNVPVPLTAVEDEHGVIPEEAPKEKPLGSLANMLGQAIRDSNLDLTHYALGAFEQRITKIVDERIAAATVQWQKDGVWVNDTYRLKPRGER